MDGRAWEVFAATALVAAVALFAGWLAVDGLIHLDEFVGAAPSAAGVARLAIRHYSGVVRLHGGTPLAAIGLASATIAAARSRRGLARG